MTPIGLGIGLGITVGGSGGGGGGPAVPMAIHLFGHQSNNTGGDVSGATATIISPDDDAVTGVYQWSVNGGGNYQTGGVPSFPAFQNVLTASTGHGRFPSGNYASDTNVGRHHNFLKAARTANPTEDQVGVLFGVGGTSINEYNTDSGTPTNWPANRYNVFKSSYDALKVAYPNTYVATIVASILENEMANNMGAANVPGYINTYISTYRAIGGTGASDAPVVFATPLKEWISNDATKMTYMLNAAKTCYANTRTIMWRPRSGYSRAGDTIHMINAGQRLSATDMYTMRAIALLTSPPAAPTFSLTGNTGVLVSNGANYYEVFVTPAATGITTKYEYVPLEYNVPGQTVKFTVPGTGNRDVYVVAKFNSTIGDSPATPTLTYTVPSSSASARVSLDFTNASMSGSSNMVTVPSDGTDTTAWDSVSSAGTGDTAAIKRQLVGSKYCAILDNATKSFIRSGYTWDAGDYSFTFGFYYGTQASNGVLVGAGQTGTALDIYISLANSGVNLRMGNNSTTVQGLTTSNYFSFNLKLWFFIAFTYNRTSNTGKMYINDELALTFTPTQRSASPSNSGGSKFFNNGLSSAVGGFAGTATPGSEIFFMPPKFFNAELSANDLQKVMNDYKVDHGVTFGYVPPAAP